MKNIIPVLFVMIIAFSCSGKQAEKQTAVEPAQVSKENALTLEFQVNGMTCTGCENTVTKSIQALPGIAEVKASWQDSLTTVTFDKTLSKPEEIKAAIEAKGYEVKGWKVLE
ncbi:MAG: cation transporter [Bacteroidales bacterium]